MSLVNQRALVGRTPEKANFVKCDRDTTQRTDVDSRLVNVQIGVAPVSPTEFVIVTMHQWAGLG